MCAAMINIWQDRIGVEQVSDGLNVENPAVMKT